MGMKAGVVMIAVVAVVTGAAWGASAGQTSAPQAAPPASSEQRSVWDGVYSEDQARRGESVYSAECVSCHGATLKGNESTPSLTGTDFADEWNGQTLGDLFKKIRRTMPQNEPGRLNAKQGADVLAYILSFNKFPSGKEELSSEAEPLKLIRFQAAKPGGK